MLYYFLEKKITHITWTYYYLLLTDFIEITWVCLAGDCCSINLLIPLVTGTGMFCGSQLLKSWTSLPSVIRKLVFPVESTRRTREGRYLKGEGNEQVKGDTERGWKTLKWHGRRGRQGGEGLDERYFIDDSWAKSLYLPPSIFCSMQAIRASLNCRYLPLNNTITSLREMELKFAIPSLSLELCLHSSLFNCGHAAFDRKWKLICSEMDVTNDGLSICVCFFPTKWVGLCLYRDFCLSGADWLCPYFFQFAVFWHTAPY